MRSPLGGAWEMVSDTMNGIAVFTDSYFSIVMAEKNRKRFATEVPTDSEAAEAYRTLSTAAGTYDLAGSTITFHRLANRNPNWTGVDISFDFSIEGQQATMKNDEGDIVWVWRKNGVELSLCYVAQGEHHSKQMQMGGLHMVLTC